MSHIRSRTRSSHTLWAVGLAIALRPGKLTVAPRRDGNPSESRSASRGDRETGRKAGSGTMLNRKWLILAALGLLLSMAWRPASAAAEEDARKVYADTLHGTVWLLWANKVGETTYSTSGSGWVVDRERKLVVTCHHVVAGTDTVRVYFPVYQNHEVIADRTYYLQKGRFITGRVLDSDPKRDLAVIELPALPPEATELKLADQSVATASRVHTVGSPGMTFVPAGQTPDPLWKYTRGEVSSVFHQKDVRQGGQVIDAMVVQTQQPINPGDSGGPVVDDDGELVAVNCAQRKSESLVSYAIDVTEVKAFLAEALAYFHPESATDFLKRGSHYLGRRRYDAAAADFTEALRLDPKNAAAYRDRADAYQAAGAREKAIADFVQALRLNPKDGYAYRQRGLCFYLLGQYDQALDDLGQALLIDPDDHQARLGRGMSSLAKGDVEAALKDLDDLLRDGPADRRAAYRYERAQAFLAAKNYDKAIEDLEAAVALAPSATDAHTALGVAYFQKGDLDKALASYGAALQLNAQYAPALLNRGQAYLKRQTLDSAIADFDAVLKLSPSAAAYASRSRAYIGKRDFDKALADLDAALRLDPRDAVSHRLRSFVCLEKGMIDQGIEDATEAIELRPSDVRVLAAAYNSRGYGYSLSGSRDKAIADYTKAIGYDGKNAVYFTNRAVSLFKSGDYERTVADCTKAIEINPKFAAAYLWRGRATKKWARKRSRRRTWRRPSNTTRG